VNLAEFLIKAKKKLMHQALAPTHCQMAAKSMWS
jgi:hypothetical protein